MDFTLHYQLQLTETQAALVAQYKLQEYPVTFRTVQGTQVPDDTLGSMVAGRS